MKIEVVPVTSAEQPEQAHRIRFDVFVIEQKVPAEEELDEFESLSRHFLACDEYHKPCGTARWRFTAEGVKLERFAVLGSYRGRGVGSALVEAVLSDVAAHPDSPGKRIYLHAQLDAMPLYKKFSFETTGPMFEECAIRHFKMIRTP